MMYRVSSLVTANAVVERAMATINSDENLPMTIVGDKSEFRIAVECYQNGREHGLIAWPMYKSSMAFYICEARRTDEICIYRGEYRMQGISEDAYRQPNTFGNDINNAADWLVCQLIVLFNEQQAAKKKKAKVKDGSH